MPNTVIELIVSNHPGVMSHVTGLFARRGYNLEGILCGPIGDGKLSRIYLLVDRGKPLAQLLTQLGKLYDVVEARERLNVDSAIFYRLDQQMNAPSRSASAETAP
jgi:acetolactate synthase I/III small subunit